MKILLIGEYSGFYNNLAAGLKELGHTVFLANTGDGKRRYHSDFDWRKGNNGFWGKNLGLGRLLLHRNLFSGFDVVQLIFPRLNSIYWLNRLMVNYLKAHNGKLFWTPSGRSHLISKFWYESTGKRCGVYDFHFAEAAKRGEGFQFLQPAAVAYETWFTHQLDGILPAAYEYAEPFRNHPKFLRTIPYPVNLDQIGYQPNTVGRKVLFYHGITRPVKGTEHICKAFGAARDRWPSEGEFVCARSLPYQEYLKVIRGSNVIVDQANSYSTALNGLIALAQGKILMGGGEKEYLDEIGYDWCPILNIKPDQAQILQTIEWVMDNRDNIEEMGFRGRQFVEKYHHQRVIASRYVESWTSS